MVAHPALASQPQQAWKLLDRYVPAGARVAIVGAGNGHDLPLRRLADRAGELWLFDLDPGALEHARHRSRRGPSVVAQQLDVSAGAVDRIIAAAIGRSEPPDPPRLGPLPGAPFDVVIADLLYSQLLYPALTDSGLPREETNECLARHGQPLTDEVVRALQASAPRGLVIHLHDLLGWWPGHPQPVTAAEIIALSATDPDAAPALAELGNQPTGCDPRGVIRSLPAQILNTAMWVWPFAPSVEYLVSATVAAERT